jgi:hypothetical protein
MTASAGQGFFSRTVSAMFIVSPFFAEVGMLPEAVLRPPEPPVEAAITGPAITAENTAAPITHFAIV